jgi:hypothetical protein
MINWEKVWMTVYALTVTGLVVILGIALIRQSGEIRRLQVDLNVAQFNLATAEADLYLCKQTKHELRTGRID